MHALSPSGLCIYTNQLNRLSIYTQPDYTCMHEPIITYILCTYIHAYVVNAYINKFIQVHSASASTIIMHMCMFMHMYA